MQVRRDARVARGSFSGAARHVNAILLSSERRRSPRDFGSREGRGPVSSAPLWPLRHLCADSRRKRRGASVSDALDSGLVVSIVAGYLHDIQR